nr:immunoglobulin light chain junction region [Macaca mulatta]
DYYCNSYATSGTYIF